MENTIGLSILGLLSIWLSVVILGEIHMSQEASRWLSKRNQHLKIKQNSQKCLSVGKND